MAAMKRDGLSRAESPKKAKLMQLLRDIEMFACKGWTVTQGIWGKKLRKNMGGYDESGILKTF